MERTEMQARIRYLETQNAAMLDMLRQWNASCHWGGESIKARRLAECSTRSEEMFEALDDPEPKAWRLVSLADIESFSAQIRAEALEEVAAFCDKYQVGVNPRSGYQISEFDAPEGTHPGMAYAKEFRRLKTQP